MERAKGTKSFIQREMVNAETKLILLLLYDKS